jgi:hypothetical protein
VFQLSHLTDSRSFFEWADKRLLSHTPGHHQNRARREKPQHVLQQLLGSPGSRSRSRFRIFPLHRASARLLWKQRGIHRFPVRMHVLGDVISVERGKLRLVTAVQATEEIEVQKRLRCDTLPPCGPAALLH